MNRFEMETHLINEMGLKMGAELGVEAGRNSKHILETTMLSHLFMIDLWVKNPSPDEPIDILNYQQSYDRSINVMLRYPNRSSILKYDTVEASKFFKDNSIDFIFIDANQTFEGHYNNFKAWFPKCRKGAVIGMKNYNHKHSYTGTRQAIIKVSNDYDLPFELSTDKYCTAFFIKE